MKVAQSCPTLCDPMDCTVHGLFLGQNTGVGSLSLLQGIFPTQGSNPGLPHCRQILYQLTHKGSPKILEWVAYLFSSGSSRPRNQTGVSCIAGGFFTSWATRKSLVNNRDTYFFAFYKKVKNHCVQLPSFFLYCIYSICHFTLWTVGVFGDYRYYLLMTALFNDIDDEFFSFPSENSILWLIR